jgi:hypothetical protein
MIGHPSRIEEVTADENPVDLFPCMNTLGIHVEARAQLYSLLTGGFLDDAMQLEPMMQQLTEDGPNIHLLDSSLTRQLADRDEDDIEELVGLWLECEPIEALELDGEDLSDFLFQLVHFCKTATQGDGLGVYLYSDG